MWRHLLTRWIFMAKLSSLIVFVNPQVFDEIGNQVILLWDVMHFWHNVTPCWEFLLETISWPKECGICRKAAETDFCKQKKQQYFSSKRALRIPVDIRLQESGFFHGAGAQILFDGIRIESDLSDDRHPILVNPWILKSLNLSDDRHHILVNWYFTIFPSQRTTHCYSS